MGDELARHKNYNALKINPKEKKLFPPLEAILPFNNQAM